MRAIKRAGGTLVLVAELIDEFRDAKWRLRDNWRCSHCGAGATQLVSIPACHAMLGVAGDPPYSMNMVEFHCQAACDAHRRPVQEYLQRIGEATGKRIFEQQDDHNLIAAGVDQDFPV